MNAVVEIVLPVFCLIGLGYLVARFGYLTEAAGDGIAAFVFKVAVPLLLMRSIATAEFADVNPWIFVLVYFIGVVISWLLAMVVIMGVFARDMRAATISGVAASFSNLVLMGIPLVERAYGPDGLQILFFLLSIHLPTMMTISSFLMEYATRVDGVDDTPVNVAQIAKGLFRNLVFNPIIVGILIGVVLRFSGIGISGLPDQVMELLARTTGPLALFSLGMGLIKYGIKGNLAPAIYLSVLSLIVMPGIVYFVGTNLLVLPVLWLKVALLAAACPTGVNAYLFATHFKVAEGLSSNAIVIALLGSVLTVPFWLSLV